jgi:hypothetical protein
MAEAQARVTASNGHENAIVARGSGERLVCGWLGGRMGVPRWCLAGGLGQKRKSSKPLVTGTEVSHSSPAGVRCVARWRASETPAQNIAEIGGDVCTNVCSKPLQCVEIIGKALFYGVGAGEGNRTHNLSSSASTSMQF